MSPSSLRAATTDFARETAAAGKVLVVEVAGLGDLVHSLPAMAAIRQTYPSAELHCLVRREYASLLALAPWIDRVWTYQRNRRSLSLRSIASTARALRAERFAVAIDLMGSDHAATAAWLSGAKRRLVRRPGPVRARFAWRWFGTDLIESPFGQEPMYLQRWHALRQAGICSAAPTFELLPGPALDSLLGAEAATARYVHLSPFTKQGRKELPPAQLVELLVRLREERGDLRLAISCSDQERERSGLDALLRVLPFAPWKVFAGTLDIPQLHALIGGAALHLGGDTASMHLAWLAGAPSVCWMSAFASHRTWAPEGERHAMVYSDGPPGEHLVGVSTEAVVARSIDLLRASAASRMRPAHSHSIVAGGLDETS